MGDKSAFYDPARVKARYHGLFVLPPPPAVHMVAYVTGGLQTLYNNIDKEWKKPEEVNKAKLGSYTNEQGHFTPHEGMPLLAGRYKYIATVGTGQSSVIIKAVDTFQRNVFAAIKVLHLSCFLIGSQEANIMLELSQDDPLINIPFIRLQNIFHFADHYCLTFELLDPNPVTAWFTTLTYPRELIINWISIIAAKLVNVLCFLKLKNIIHADLKPDNILLTAGTEIMDVKVVDFGNAIHCVHDELSLYYSDYEVQTLSYRAPEVLLGVQVGQEVDIWSLGCILAELYTGKPLFSGQNKTEIMKKIVYLLGPLPVEFQNGKFATQYHQYFGTPYTKLKINQNLHQVLGCCEDSVFIDFLSQMLSLNPNVRINPLVAQYHQFLSPLPSHSSLLLEEDECYHQLNGLELIQYKNVANDEQLEIEELKQQQQQTPAEMLPLFSVVPINRETYVPEEISIMQSQRKFKLRESCHIFISMRPLIHSLDKKHIAPQFKSLLMKSFPLYKELILLLLKKNISKDSLKFSLQTCAHNMHCMKFTAIYHFSNCSGKMIDFHCLQKDHRKNYSYIHNNLMKNQIAIFKSIKDCLTKLIMKKTPKKLATKSFVSIHKHPKIVVTVICCGKLLKPVEKCKRCLSLLQNKKIKCKFILIKKMLHETTFASLRKVYRLFQ